MNVLHKILEWIMNNCYYLCGNYGFAIILFTLVSKIVLLPVSIWVQKNSIKMVRMQPEINYLKVQHFGDQDMIAEKQLQLFKKEKYNPMASIFPLIIQLVLLVGLIEVIKSGIDNPTINMDFFGIQLGLVPNITGGTLILSPIIAGVSAWVLCVAQNTSNVLQAEQSKANKYCMMLLSVGLSLYLGWFVPVGVAVYWVASNLMAIVQLYLLNWTINPKDYVDYDALEDSKKKLERLSNIGDAKKRHFWDAESKREREDYRRFFKVVNKHLVFYSEGSGFYKYYRGLIEYILEHTNMLIHYVTSDPNDAIFELSKQKEHIRAYYIGEKKLITLMMKMDADIVVMTMPDLNNFHIKRSYVRKDIEYIYIPHGMDSLNMTMRTGAIDHFDTIFCTGKHQWQEITETERVYDLKPKKLVKWGYTLLDEMRTDYSSKKRVDKNDKTILVAPSWQDDNIVDSCLDELLEVLCGKGYKIVVRPHPQHVRHQPKRMEELKSRFSDSTDIEIQTDFSSNNTVFEADMMITDWSGIAYEYAFTTCKPVLFINTPMKIMNSEYQRINVEPINIWMRDKIGAVLEINNISKAADAVADMLEASELYRDIIDEFIHEYVYNLGTSSEVGAKYIIEQVQENAKKRKEGRK